MKIESLEISMDNYSQNFKHNSSAQVELNPFELSSRVSRKNQEGEPQENLKVQRIQSRESNNQSLSHLGENELYDYKQYADAYRASLGIGTRLDIIV